MASVVPVEPAETDGDGTKPRDHVAKGKLGWKF
jgi:hypothetical protein